MTDPIADYLTRLRNAIKAQHRVVEIPSSKLKKEITKILFDQGYILNYKFVEEENSVHWLQGHAPRAQRFRYCHHLHFQGRYDQQGSQEPEDRWRSIVLRLLMED